LLSGYCKYNDGEKTCNGSDGSCPSLGCEEGRLYWIVYEINKLFRLDRRRLSNTRLCKWKVWTKRHLCQARWMCLPRTMEQGIKLQKLKSRIKLKWIEAEDGGCYNLRVYGLKGAAISLVVLIVSILACQGGYNLVQNNSWVRTTLTSFPTMTHPPSQNISTHKPTQNIQNYKKSTHITFTILFPQIYRR